MTNSQTLAEAVVAEIERQSADLSRREIIAKSLADYGAIVVFQEIEQMLAFADEIAPEHLEIMLQDPLQYIGKVHNAG